VAATTFIPIDSIFVGTLLTVGDELGDTLGDKLGLSKSSTTIDTVMSGTILSIFSTIASLESQKYLFIISSKSTPGGARPSTITVMIVIGTSVGDEDDKFDGKSVSDEDGKLEGKIPDGIVDGTIDDSITLSSFVVSLSPSSSLLTAKCCSDEELGESKVTVTDLIFNSSSNPRTITFIRDVNAFRCSEKMESFLRSSVVRSMPSSVTCIADCLIGVVILTLGWMEDSVVGSNEGKLDGRVDGMYDGELLSSELGFTLGLLVGIIVGVYEGIALG